MVEGQAVSVWLLRVDQQPEVGEEGYDEGALILADFFRKQVRSFLESDLDPLGREIIDCCLSDGSVEDYASLVPGAAWVSED